MKGWALKFKLVEGNNVIDIELEGNVAAIRVGLNLSYLTVGDKLKQRIAQGNFPPGLIGDASLLYAIQTGSPIREYKGEYLEIVPVRKVDGLRSSVSVEWSD